MSSGGKKRDRKEFFEAAIARFWSYVDRRGPNDCWPWTSTKGAANEYGMFGLWDGVRQVNYRAHRMAWMLTSGAIPDGLIVMHSCDTPICCNPSHLSVGTMADNMTDRNEKGRHAHGEKQGHAKLTEDQARYALESNEPTTVLGERFGVHPSGISKIRSGVNWKHLQ